MNAPEPTESGTCVELGTDEGFALRAIAGGVQVLVREMAGLVAAHAGMINHGERIDISNRQRFMGAANDLAGVLAAVPVPPEYELRFVRIPPEKRRTLAAVHAAGHAVVGAALGCEVVKVELDPEPEGVAAGNVTWGKGPTTLLGTPCRPPDPVRIELQPRVRNLTVAILAGYWAELAAAPDIAPRDPAADVTVARRLAAQYADPGGEGDWLAAADEEAARLVQEHGSTIAAMAETLSCRGCVAEVSTGRAPIPRTE
jgi:hypothetical protein